MNAIFLRSPARLSRLGLRITPAGARPPGSHGGSLRSPLRGERVRRAPHAATRPSPRAWRLRPLRSVAWSIRSRPSAWVPWRERCQSIVACASSVSPKQGVAAFEKRLDGSFPPTRAGHSSRSTELSWGSGPLVRRNGMPLPPTTRVRESVPCAAFGRRTVTSHRRSTTSGTPTTKTTRTTSCRGLFRWGRQKVPP